MGVDAQIGVKAEVAYGTYVAPDRFYELLSESLKLNVERIESASWRAGVPVVRASRRKAGARSVQGNLELEAPTKGLGVLLLHAFGAVTSSQPDNVGSPTVWDHVFKLGGLKGKSLTVQVGRDDRSDVVQPFSYLGCKVSTMSLQCALNEILRVSFGFLGRDETTAQALAVASYLDSDVFTFVDGSLTIEGTPVPIKEFSLELDNGFEADHAFGSALSREPEEPAIRTITGNLDADFDGLTQYNLFTAGTVSTLVAKFESGIIEDAFKFTLQVTAEVMFDGETPEVSGPTEIRLPLPYKVVAPAAGEPIEVLYRTSDTTP